MGALRGWHIIVLLVVILLLFGAPKLPELARSIGKSLNILKDETSNLRSSDKDKDASAEPATTASATPEATPQAQPQTPTGASAADTSIPDSTVNLPSDDEARGK